MTEFSTARMSGFYPNSEVLPPVRPAQTLADLPPHPLVSLDVLDVQPDHRVPTLDAQDLLLAHHVADKVAHMRPQITIKDVFEAVRELRTFNDIERPSALGGKSGKSFILSGLVRAVASRPAFVHIIEPADTTSAEAQKHACKIRGN